MENKKINFSEWYNEIIEVSGLSDKRYPIKGMNVWLPYGLKVMQNIDRSIRQSVDSRNFQEVSFPVLITRDQLSVEFDHVKGFEGEVYWVTRGGREPLDVEMALRPTSEAAMYGMFSLWVRAHTDLPMKFYQIVSVYRYETKHTRSFIRVRELHFFESHTVHHSYEDSERQMEEYLDVWAELTKVLCLPFEIHKRPEWDKFPGAMYTLAFDTIMPGGRSMQIGTIHQYGTNFSKTYDIKYLKEDGEHAFAHQTTFGLSERLLAAVIGLHGDDQGLILPPGIAPLQAVIVPIPSKKADTVGFANKVNSILLKNGFRTKVDDRDNYTPGFKFNDWEMKGVPVRIEIGERELNENAAVLVPRTEKKKIKVDIPELPTKLSELHAEVEKTLMERAEKQFQDSQINVSSLEELAKVEGFVHSGWCGEKECADNIEEKFEFGTLGFDPGNITETKCIVCGKPGMMGTFSRSY